MSITSQVSRTFFNGYNVTATSNFIYNTSESIAATSGWVKCKSDYVVVQCGIATLNATSIKYRIEGKFTGLNRPASILAASYISATSKDLFHTISDRFEYIRVGVKVECASSVAASPNNFYAGVCLTDVK